MQLAPLVKNKVANDLSVRSRPLQWWGYVPSSHKVSLAEFERPLLGGGERRLPLMPAGRAGRTAETSDCRASARPTPLQPPSIHRGVSRPPNQYSGSTHHCMDGTRPTLLRSRSGAIHEAAWRSNAFLRGYPGPLMAEPPLGRRARLSVAPLGPRDELR